ncbi:MAG TPA: AAA family ATPase [Polyangium sp.]|nr:AAA family ATPase [Polyangium sp.]
MPTPAQAEKSVRQAIIAASDGLIERRSLVELIALAAIAGEHVLVIGPPGTAKSEAVRRIASSLGGKYFEYLLGRFTEPSEIFGPVSLKRLKDGVVETETAGMLPEADIAFLDEVFLGSTAILNTLLGILNERRFRRGHTAIQCPLRVCVGASNRLPEDEMLAAFADRFLVRVFVGPIGDSRLEELLDASWQQWQPQKGNVAAIGDIDALSQAARNIDMTHVRSTLAQAIRIVRGVGVELTDRRAARLQRLVAAAASIAGKNRADERDLWPIVYAIPTEAAQQLARDALRDLLASSENTSLSAAAEESSFGPRARAQRIVTHAKDLLDAAPKAEDKPAHKLKLEGVAREIDAGFSPSNIPPELAEIRTRITNLLAPSK